MIHSGRFLDTMATLSMPSRLRSPPEIPNWSSPALSLLIVSVTSVPNVRSRRVMEKLGMTRSAADDFLHPLIEEAITKKDLVGASVLSGNRNFEARVHQSIRANFLMSPPLVVAFALAGRVDIDLVHEPLGLGGNRRELQQHCLGC